MRNNQEILNLKHQLLLTINSLNKSDVTDNELSIAMLLTKDLQIQNLFKTPNEWICNECNFPNFTESVSEIEVERELHSCIHCGGFEFHLEDRKQ